jgi:hypothetical protein
MDQADAGGLSQSQGASWGAALDGGPSPSATRPGNLQWTRPPGRDWGAVTGGAIVEQAAGETASESPAASSGLVSDGGPSARPGKEEWTRSPSSQWVTILGVIFLHNDGPGGDAALDNRASADGDEDSGVGRPEHE